MVTVNSVVCRWSIEARNQSAGENRSLAVLTKLQLKGRGQRGRLDGLSGRRRDGDRDTWEERQQLEAQAGSDGTLRVAGLSEFHFLLPRRTYCLSLGVEGSQVPLLWREAQTLSVGRGLPAHLACTLAEETWILYIGQEHELGEWLAQSPESMLWTFRPDFAMLRKLWLNACFTLPDPNSPIVD